MFGECFWYFFRSVKQIQKSVLRFDLVLDRFFFQACAYYKITMFILWFDPLVWTSYLNLDGTSHSNLFWKLFAITKLFQKPIMLSFFQLRTNIPQMSPRRDKNSPLTLKSRPQGGHPGFPSTLKVESFWYLWTLPRITWDPRIDITSFGRCSNR